MNIRNLINPIICIEFRLRRDIMDYDRVLIELNILIGSLDGLIDIMIQSTKEVIDIGNVNYELKKDIDRMDIVIDSADHSDEKITLETAKDHITYASVDVLDEADIFNKINRLKIAKSILINIKTKWECRKAFK
jgi:hypothetical protein